MKKLICLILSLTIILCAFTTTALAKENKVNDLQKLAEKYDLVIDEDYCGKTILEAKDLEDLEDILKNLSLMQSQVIESEYIIEVDKEELLNNEPKITMLPTNRATGYKVITWWSPLWYFPASLYLFQWKNVGFNYSYYFSGGNPRFSYLSNINSWIAGYQTGVTYAHKGDDYSITHYATSTKASITTTGTLTVGLVIGNQTIGVTLNQTWNCSYTLTS